MLPRSALLVTIVWIATAVVGQAEPTRPNVLFVAIDDLNDYITPLDGYPGLQTPNFERLAARGVTFTNAHCAAPACHPSRVATMTGVRPSRSGLYTNLFGSHGPRWRSEAPLLADAVVLSQHFRNHGYRAIGGGKIFHTLQWTPGDSQNDPAAWDFYFRDPLDPLPPWPRPVLIPDETAGLTPGRPLSQNRNHPQLFGAAPLDVRDEETSDHQIVDWAIGELAQSHEQPLFLAVGLFRPHIPFEVPRRYFDQFPIETLSLPVHRDDDLNDAYDQHERRAWHRWVLENNQWHRLLQGYLASIRYCDNQVGRLLDALDASPARDHTIVVVWSDHGFHVGEKELWEKFALWDQTTRVPLFICAPGVTQAASRCRQPVSLVDIYPTLCELAGLPVPQQCDGASLVAQLRDTNTPRQQPAVCSHVFQRAKEASHAVRDERYRLIRYHDGFEELYDLETDPHEFTNRVSDPSLAEVRLRLAAHLPASPAAPAKIPEP